MINFDDFKKVDIRMGKIVSAEKIEGSSKLLKLEVDFGTDEGNPNETIKRIILAGLAKFYTKEELIGKFCPFVFNLEPKKMGQLESQGMILCADSENGPVLLHPNKDILPGSIIK